MTEFQKKRIEKERKKFEDAICWSYPGHTLKFLDGAYVDREIQMEWLEWCRCYEIELVDSDDERVHF